MRERYDLRGWPFIAPALLFLAACVIYPLYKVVQLSFFQYSAQARAFTFVGLDQFRQLLGDPLFWTSLKNTAVFTLGSIALHLGLGYPIALLLNARWPSVRMRNFFRGALIFPFLFSAPAAALLWGLLLRPLGPVNYALESLVGTRVAFLGDPRWALATVLWVNGWQSFPLYMVLILGGLQGIPPVLYEAARVDGANWLQRFWHVTVPQMRSLTMTVILIDFATTFIHFDLVWTMTKGGPLRSTYLISFYLYQKGIQEFRLGYGAAVGVAIALIMAVCITAYVYLYTRRGEQL